MNNDWMHNITDTVAQVSILDALLARKFDGCLPCRELLKYGDFGIGTYDRMDGEMVLVDGTFYQAKGDGKVYEPDLDNRTPFASVCRFQPEKTWTLSKSINVEAMKKEIDKNVPNQNVFVAVRVEGSFSYMKTHALQIQSKPYPSTAEVVKACVQSETKDISGTIVGFRSPPYVRGIGDPGYHLHFLSDDKTQGGHVLAFDMVKGDCAIDQCSNYHVILPENGAALADVDLSGDLVKEFHEELASGH
ncbi:MAG: acetolactate decarboxylase [Planctomycetes bacterium]|nr:acetolactate decarboxylase [Planctomycetota bacterium]